MTLILVFIIVLNIIAIALTYYCLSDLEKKDKVIFIAVCVAIIYMLTTFVYWISTKSVAVKEVSDLGKNLITFLFVPINTLVVVPLFAKSYNKYKTGFLAFDKLRNRGIVLGAILLIILIIECVYFKNVQNTVITLIEKNQQTRQNANDERIETNTLENIIENVDGNMLKMNTVNSIVSNSTVNNTNSVSGSSKTNTVEDIIY